MVQLLLDVLAARYQKRNRNVTSDCLCIEICAKRYGFAAYMNAMRNRFVIGLAIVVAGYCVWSAVRRRPPDYVEYRGEKIKLSKYYSDYDSYKNDPDNIAPSETTRVQQL